MGSIPFLCLLITTTFAQPPPPIPEHEPSSLGDSDSRPAPPAIDKQAVQSLIDELLTGQRPKNAGPIEIEGPLKMINSSKYWSLENLAPEGSIDDDSKAKMWLNGYLKEAETILKMATEAGWNYFTNITDFNRQMLVDSEEVLGGFLKSTAIQAKQFDLASFTHNGTLQRLMHMLSIEGMGALADDEFEKLGQIKSELAHILTNGAVCRQGRPPPCTRRFPELQPLMATSRNPSQLLYIWLAWRNAVGGPMKIPYADLVQISNIGANLNGFEDAGALWRSPYEMTAPTLGHGPELDLKEELERVFEQIKPLYVQLHAYMRNKLAGIFNPASVELSKDRPIPAHLLGSMNAENWASLFLETQPFPPTELEFNADPWAMADPIGAEMLKKNFTVKKMFHQAEEFFTSMGFPKLPASFWNNSILERPWDRDMLCHPATAFDFRDGKEFRVKSCSQVSQPDFTEIHRLLAQSYYHYSYRNLSLPFREAANPSFSSAVADALAAAAENANYLKSLGLESKELEVDHSKQINRLYQEALQQVTGLPFALVVDLWRWQVFDGTLNNETWNQGWWMLREKYQGIRPPAERPAHHFDPGASPLISQEHFPAVRRFISYILKFQLLKGLCGQQGPLNVTECDLHGSKMAGQKLLEMMALGSSQPWTEVLMKVTGSQKLDSTPLMEYYQPLTDWLAAENRKTNAYLGWDGPGTLYEPFEMQPQQPDFEGNSVAEPPAAGSFAGESCSSGQICIQDSICNGTLCVCPEGMVQLQQHCLPNDPSVQGFGNSAGFHLNIIQNEQPEPEAETEPKPEPKSASVACFSIWMTLFYAVVTLLR